MTRKRGELEDELVELLPRLRRFGVALTGSRHDADDLVQATVRRILEKPAPDGVELARWAFRVSRNMWIDEIRSRKVRTATPLEDAPEAGVTDGEKMVMDRLLFDQVNRSMATLPEDQRAVMTLVAVEGYSYKETAQILEIPIGTVMSRLSRARSALAELIATPQSAV